MDPSLQREGDASLMERFMTIEWATQSILRKVNDVQLYLRVVTIADLADESGQVIPDGILCGDWQAGSDLVWPRQPNPPKSHWALFWRCLRHTFCVGTSPYQLAYKGMQLDVPLGRWYTVERNTWYRCYKSEECLYFRGPSEDILQRFKKSSAPGFYIFDCDVAKDSPRVSPSIAPASRGGGVDSAAVHTKQDDGEA